MSCCSSLFPVGKTQTLEGSDLSLPWGLKTATDATEGLGWCCDKSRISNPGAAPWLYEVSSVNSSLLHRHSMGFLSSSHLWPCHHLPSFQQMPLYSISARIYRPRPLAQRILATLCCKMHKPSCALPLPSLLSQQPRVHPQPQGLLLFESPEKLGHLSFLPTFNFSLFEQMPKYLLWVPPPPVYQFPKCTMIFLTRWNISAAIPFVWIISSSPFIIQHLDLNLGILLSKQTSLLFPPWNWLRFPSMTFHRTLLLFCLLPFTDYVFCLVAYFNCKHRENGSHCIPMPNTDLGFHVYSSNKWMNGLKYLEHKWRWEGEEVEMWNKTYISIIRWLMPEEYWRFCFLRQIWISKERIQKKETKMCFWSSFLWDF